MVESDCKVATIKWWKVTVMVESDCKVVTIKWWKVTAKWWKVTVKWLQSGGMSMSWLLF